MNRSALLWATLAVGATASGCSEGPRPGFSSAFAAAGVVGTDPWRIELVDAEIVQGVPSDLELLVTNESGSDAIEKLTFKLPDGLPYTLLSAIPPPGWTSTRRNGSSACGRSPVISKTTPNCRMPGCSCWSEPAIRMS